MATTLSDIRSRVRLRLDDSQFDGVAIDRAINDYQRDLTNRQEFIFMEVSTEGSDPVLTTNSTTLVLPTVVQRINGLILRSPVNQRADYSNYYLDYETFVRQYPATDLNPVGMPYWWTTYAQNIRFSQPADTNYTFRVEYLRAAPTLVNDADTVVVPDEFTEILVLGALYRLQKRDDDYELASNEAPDLRKMEIALIGRYGRGQLRRGPRKMVSPFRG